VPVSLERCRKLLGSEPHLSDDELVALRSQMESLAALICDRAGRRLRDGRSGGSIPGLLSEAQRDDFRERAAIMEFEGGSDRRTAERRALRVVIGGRTGEEP
jgi:hypothetical protein